MSTGSNARSRMYLFVTALFVVGLMLAGYYMFVKTPGEVQDSPTSEVVNPNS